jgi:hypothetical protein
MNEPVTSAARSSGHQGKYAVIAILGVAIFAAAFGWYWNVSRGRKTLSFFGPEAARLIRSAPIVEIVVPESKPGTKQGGIDISRAPGLLNARSSLLDDASYEWETPPADDSMSGHVQLRFALPPSEARLRLDFDARTVCILPGGQKATLVKKTAEGWRTFIARHAQNDSAK